MRKLYVAQLYASDMTLFLYTFASTVSRQQQRSVPINKKGETLRGIHIGEVGKLPCRISAGYMLRISHCRPMLSFL